MKNRLQKIVVIFMCLIAVVLCFQNTSYAASFKATVSSKTITVGDTITLNLTADNAAGNYKVTISDTSKLSVVSGNIAEWLEAGSTKLTLKANAVGSVTITATATDMADLDNSRNKVKDSHSFTITIKEKEQPKPPTTNNNNNNGGSSNNNTKEPTFTKVNKTVYATGSINLRSSWSTNSSATKVEKGTELKLTGTSKEKINGYVWYRVTYNGKIKYVSKDLVTETKPAEETPTEKSNNKALKSLTVAPGELTPAFDAETTKYNMQVEQGITEVTIEALAEDEKAKIEVAGNKELKLGENTVTIKVTAEDETVRTYTIIVLRGEAVKAPQLSLLSVKSGKLNPIFQSDVHSYELELTEDLSKIDMDLMTVGNDAKFEVIGNENLKDGSVIKIIVYTGEKDADGSVQTEYQIKIKKNVTAAATTNIFGDIDQKTLIVVATIIIVTAGIIALFVARYFTTKGNKKETPEEGDFGVFDGLSGVKNKEDNDYEEMRRRLANQDDLNPKEDDLDFDGDKKPRGKRFM